MQVQRPSCRNLFFGLAGLDVAGNLLVLINPVITAIVTVDDQKMPPPS